MDGSNETGQILAPMEDLSHQNTTVDELHQQHGSSFIHSNHIVGHFEMATSF